jgi:predicted ATP-dependent protease
MTPAEKQRAYRQRLAEQRANQVPAVTLEKATARAWTRIEQLEQQLAEAQKDLTLKQTQLTHWIKRAESAERELESRDEKERWAIQRCPKGGRKWTEAGAPGHAYENKEWAEDAMNAMQKEAGDKVKYRIIKL